MWWLPGFSKTPEGHLPDGARPSGFHSGRCHRVPFASLEGWHPLRKMRTHTFSTYLRDDILADEMDELLVRRLRCARMRQMGWTGWTGWKMPTARKRAIGRDRRDEIDEMQDARWKRADGMEQKD